MAETFEHQASRLFVSADEGANWQRVSAGLAGAGVLALARDPGAPGTLYAGTFGRGVFKSTDASASWNRMNTGIMAAHVAFQVLYRSDDGGASAAHSAVLCEFCRRRIC